MQAADLAVDGTTADGTLIPSASPGQPPTLQPVAHHNPARLGLRVLTVNTHKGFTALNRRFMLPALRDAVRQVGADLVFLQEVLGAHDGHAQRHPGWPVVPQYEFLANDLWPQFAYGRNAVSPVSHHGNALLSRYPIQRFHNRDISLHGDERRGLLHCEIALPGGRPALHAVCVHLGLRESHRQRQLDMLCELIEREVPAGSPLVVAGDFNDWRHRAHVVLEQGAGLSEVFQHAHGKSARTFPARWPLLHLDRIYVRDVVMHTPVALPRQPWTHLSDHAPLAAEVQL